MPTIEYNGGRPAAYEDMQSPGNPQSGQNNWWDDRFDEGYPRETRVDVSVRVLNVGTGDGRAQLVLANIDDSDFDEGGGIVASSGPPKAVGAAQNGTPGQTNFELTYRVPDDRKMNLAAQVRDMDEPGRINVIKERTFTVNSYEVPRVANLSSGDISISVS